LTLQLSPHTMKTFHILFTFFAALLALFGCNNSSHTTSSGEILLHHANFVRLDNGPKIEAVLLRGDTIAALYYEGDHLPQADQIINLNGAWVYPGWIDAHTHFLAYAKGLQEVNLVGTTSWDEVLQRLMQFASAHPEGELVGRGWDQNDWPESAFPTRSDLDSLFPERLVYLSRVDGHAVLVNGAVLQTHGLKAPHVVEGGEIIHEDGWLTGVLIDAAMDLAPVPKWSRNRLVNALLDAEKHLLEVGLTGIAEAGLTGDEIALLDSLYEQEALQLRTYAMISLQDTLAVRDALARGPLVHPHFQVRSVKCYSDGALGSRGACLFEPYNDRAHHHGALLYDSITLHRWANEIYNAGFQLNTHAIGDSANAVILQIYNQVLPATADARWRIEHAQIVREEDRAYFDAHRILPSVQPTHATSDAPWAEKRLGSERMHRAYAYQSLLRESGRIPLGTDFPVEGIDPLATFRSAVYRVNEIGQPSGGFLPNEALTPEQTLLGMTENAAFAQFEEHKKGAIEVGKYADFTILDRDLRAASLDDLSHTRVLATWIAGKQVYNALELANSEH